jgi:preprotein translocase subunit SecD
MVFYYRLSGINAIIALILNIIILMGTLAYFEAVLTLPGIAGIILTIGMAVDANVLVFERIREELSSGKGILSSITAGFSRAFKTILDANMTTIIAAIFLFQFGTGPIKGFAVTLIIGITASMFTAVFVSHLIFDVFHAKRKKREKLSI